MKLQAQFPIGSTPLDYACHKPL